MNVNNGTALTNNFGETTTNKVLGSVMGLPGGLKLLTGAGAPTDGTTGDNVAGPGSLYIDTTGANIYVQTAVITAPVWKLVTRAA